MSDEFTPIKQEWKKQAMLIKISVWITKKQPHGKQK